MTDRQTEIPADEMERIRNYLGAWAATVGTETPEGVPLAKQLLSHADALSVRLAQECALRAQAEQERDEARREADVNNEAGLDLAFEVTQLKARLRVLEEALELIADRRGDALDSPGEVAARALWADGERRSS